MRDHPRQGGAVAGQLGQAHPDDLDVVAHEGVEEDMGERPRPPDRRAARHALQRGGECGPESVHRGRHADRVGELVELPGHTVEVEVGRAPAVEPARDGRRVGENGGDLVPFHVTAGEPRSGGGRRDVLEPDDAERLQRGEPAWRVQAQVLDEQVLEEAAPELLGELGRVDAGGRFAEPTHGSIDVAGLADQPDDVARPGLVGQGLEGLHRGERLVGNVQVGRRQRLCVPAELVHESKERVGVTEHLVQRRHGPGEHFAQRVQGPIAHAGYLALKSLSIQRCCDGSMRSTSQ